MQDSVRSIPVTDNRAQTLAMLAELEVLQSLPARYLILDVSADLRERQRAIGELGPRLDLREDHARPRVDRVRVALGAVDAVVV